MMMMMMASRRCNTRTRKIMVTGSSFHYFQQASRANKSSTAAAQIQRRRTNTSAVMAMMASPPLLAVGILHWSSTSTVQQRHHGTTVTRNDGSKNDNNNNNNNNNNEKKKKTANEQDSTGQPQLFDVTTQWNNAKEYLEQKVLTTTTSRDESSVGSSSKRENKGGWLGFLKGRLGGGLGGGNRDNDDDVTTISQDKKKKNSNKETQETKQNLEDVKSSLMGIMMGRSPNQRTVEDLISKARNSSEQGDVSDSVSLEELLTILRTSGDEFSELIKKNLHGKDLPTILPTNLYYFLENEDEIKNFSWRRRKHRFCRGFDIEYVNELNSFMRIAEIGYLDDMEKIKHEISETFGYEVIFCQMDSLPGKPSHFVAVKKNQSQWSSSLDMMLCVRGTKTITDVITDLLADTVDYRGGKAHSGICKSGKYLAEKHIATFEEFLKASGKKKINLTVVGHSLGAGAASIAGVELHDRDDFDVQVIGFGCPALLSKELSESTKDYITTVVADNDCIPRMSLANMMNVLLDIGEYNWVPRAKQDLEDVICQVQMALPTIISDSVKQNLMDMLSTKVLSSIEIPPSTKERMEPVLFPPGKCIHFYRDGYGISGAVVPCTFFDSIDVHRRMVDDHLFDTGYRLTFLDVMRQYKNDNYFQFEIKK